MLENGYIKLYRSLLKWEWYDDVNTKVVFLHLLLTVSIDDSRWHGTVIRRGSRVSSYPVLAKETGLSVKQVRTAIAHLEETGEVARTKHPKYTVFAINNYDAFQSGAGKTAGKGRAEGRVRAGKGRAEGRVRAGKGQQYKKVKEDKEDKESFYSSSSSLSCTSAAAPEEKDIKAYAEEIGASCDVPTFYRTMQEQGWQSGGQPIRNWKAVFRAWEEKDKQRRKEEREKPNPVYGTFVQNLD